MTDFTHPSILAALEQPTVRTYEGEFGFDTTSPIWKDTCAALPSFKAVQWLGYATAVFPASIGGRDIILQPWMGHCEQFLWGAKYPGGYGGEVGVYVKVQGGKSLPDISVLPLPMQLALKWFDKLDGENIWWPDPTLQPAMDFTIYNPQTDDVLLRAETDGDYWLNKWMEPVSYRQWCAGRSGVPAVATGYAMKFTVDDVTRDWRPGSGSR